MSPSRHSSADSHRQGRGRIGRSAERAPVARRAQDREQNADGRSQPSAISILRSACYSRLNAWQIWPSATRATIRRMVHGARLAATTAPASETYYPRAQRQRRATDPISAKTEESALRPLRRRNPIERGHGATQGTRTRGSSILLFHLCNMWPRAEGWWWCGLSRTG